MTDTKPYPLVHASDCAVHNAPALPVGPCDCSADAPMDVNSREAALWSENMRLKSFVDWVDSWVSNPVGSYSVAALDGLFGMTRDQIERLKQPREQNQ